MKKLWIALFGAILLLSSFAGAGHAASTRSHANSAASKLKGCNGKGNITFFHWGDKNVDTADKKAIAAAEKACPGLHVTDDWDQGNYDVDLKTKIGSGNAPDLFQLDGSKVLAQYAQQGALAPLDSFIKRDHLNMKKTFVPQCLPEMSYKGKVYGLMLACSNQDLLFYNKDMFTARHVAFPTNKWTYKDFRAAAMKLTGDYALPSDKTTKLRFGYVGSTDDFATQQYLFEWGTNWVNKQATQCTIDSKKSQAALQWWVNLMYKDHGAPTSTQAASLGDKVAGFRSQAFALSFMGPWAENYAFGNSPGSTTTPVTFKWGVVDTPKGLVNRNGLMASTAEVIYAHSKNKNAAWWLDRFVTEGSGAKIQSEYGDDTPGAIALYKNSAIKKEYGQVLKIEEMAAKHGQIPAQLPNYSEFQTAVAAALDPMWKGSESVAAATHKACATAQQYLK